MEISGAGAGDGGVGGGTLSSGQLRDTQPWTWCTLLCQTEKGISRVGPPAICTTSAEGAAASTREPNFFHGE